MGYDDWFYGRQPSQQPNDSESSGDDVGETDEFDDWLYGDYEIIDETGEYFDADTAVETYVAEAYVVSITIS